MRKKIYVGRLMTEFWLSDIKLEIFRSEEYPTEEAYLQYVSVIGPFKTVRAAKWCVDHPNAQCATVKEFERAEAVSRCQSELIQGNLDHLNRRIFYKTELDKMIG